MKKVILAITLCLFTASTIISCTEENISPKKEETDANGSGGSQGPRP